MSQKFNSFLDFFFEVYYNLLKSYQFFQRRACSQVILMLISF